MTDVPSRKVALAAAATAVALPAFGAWIYRANAPRVHDLIRIELGDRSVFARLDKYGHPLQTVAMVHHTLPWDYLFIAMYGVGLLIGCWLALTMSWTVATRGAALVGLVCTTGAVGCDIVEDLFLRYGTWWDAGGAVSTAKWCLIVPAVIIAALGVVLTVARAVGNRPSRLETVHKTLDPIHVVPGRSSAHQDDDVRGAGTRWRSAYAVPDVDEEQLRTADYPRTAICLSGGGVRSASFALGAIQAMRDKVLRADYLISVSGGGYTAGALIQALQPQNPPDEPDADVLREPMHALMPGTVEEDHIRRHSSYLADSPWRLFLALLLLMRGLLATLFVLYSGAIVIGVLAGVFYKNVPITPLTEVKVANGSSSHVTFPLLRHPALFALAAVAAIAVLAWVVTVFCASIATWESRLCQIPRAAASFAAGLATVIGVFVIGIPTLTWFCAWLYTKLGHGPGVTVGGPLGTVLVSYVATVVSVLWRRRSNLLPKRDKSGNVVPLPAAVPRSVTQMLTVILVLGLLMAAWLVLFGISASTRANSAALWSAFGVAIGWIVMGGLVDETAMSLHPFYRKRIASAFAVRAVRKANGDIAARGYLPSEVTSLPAYGHVDVPTANRAFPTMIFAASANLDDNAYTAPGLRAVSYTMNSEWIGGPDVGWLRTRDAMAASPPHLRRDLTVQAAVAISGAAFASAMGRASNWYETLLAVSGARLGSWLPHPDYVKRRKEAAEAGDWTLPGLPRVRRMSYLVREVFNVHPFHERLLHVTDGGHYENLGLVEALRRRCTEIYVFDASGDGPPTASTFAEAIRLAHDELGVEITPVDPFELVAGGADPLEPATPPITALHDRLSKTAVITAKVKYPEESGLPPNRRERGCKIVFAKAMLTEDLPYEVLSYATRNDIFPHDSTADQWFDEGQFSQYKRLGFVIGQVANLM